MKKLISLLLLICVLVSTTAVAEQANGIDATYYTLYTQMLNCVDNQTPDENLQLLHIDNATVWKKTDDIAGFSFDGKGWDIFGECDMVTGVITRIFCKLPYSKAGLLAIYGITFCLSGEVDTATFFEKYVPDDAVLRDIPFPEYQLTINGGAEDTFIFEYERNAEIVVRDKANLCPMKDLIESMQK